MTAQISASMVKELRDRTGVGMSKCKEALKLAEGDMELAIDNLRKSGMASAVKKEGRQTNEGVIAVSETEAVVALLEVNAETDFVVQNDSFQEFAKNAAQELANTQATSLEAYQAQSYSLDSKMTIEEYRATTIQSLGENIQFGKMLCIKKEANCSIAYYSHMKGKIVTAVVIEGAADQQDLARDVAMHVAAEAPDYVDSHEVPQEILEREKDVAKGQVQGKPENIIDKIVEGKLNAFYNRSCLLRQPYIKDADQTVGQFVKAAGSQLKLKSFVRWTVGV